MTKKKKARLKGYNLLLLKAYFDKGFALTYYLKYAIAFFGIASRDAKTTLIIAGIYGLSCFVVGVFWYSLKLVETENEICNQFNPFVKEMRDFKNDKSKKKTIL